MELVGLRIQPDPHQMKVIGHQTVDRAEQSIPMAGMEEQLAEPQVKDLAQGKRLTLVGGEDPMNGRVGLVEGTRESREVMLVGS